MGRSKDFIVPAHIKKMMRKTNYVVPAMKFIDRLHINEKVFKCLCGSGSRIS